MNLSISKINVFNDCERHFYYQINKIEQTDKIPDKYGKFGNCVHEAIENIYKFNNFREAVNHYWIKYELPQTDMNIKTAYDCVQYSLSLGYEFKQKEEKIKFEYKGHKFTSIIDGVLNDNSILDWKTSTYESNKVNDYKNQITFYAWVYWRVKGIIPPYGILVFNKEQKNGKFLKPFKFEINEYILKEFQKKLDLEIDKIESRKNFSDYKYDRKKCFFCAYKKKCYSENINEIKIFKDYNTFQLNIKDSVLDKVIDNNYSYEIDNKFFFQKALKEKYEGYHHDGIIHLVKRGIIPIGFIKDTKRILNDYSKYKKENFNIIELNPEYPTNKIETPNKLNIPFEFWDFQKDIINKAIEEKIFFGDIATGAGKTCMSAEIIRRLKYKTLFVVDTIDLLEQAKETFEESLNIECGIISAGKQDWKDVNIATIQTCSKLLGKKEKRKIIKHPDSTFVANLQECNLLIIDEAHGSKAKSYQKLFEYSKSEYRIGLSGTAYKDGNSSLELYKSLGFPLVKISTKYLIDIGFLVKPKIKFINYDTPDFYMGNYDDIFSQIVIHPNKMKIFSKIIQYEKDNFNLIICRRIEHIEIIQKQLIELGLILYIITGEITKKRRKYIREQMKIGNIHILIGTDSIVQKGLNIPRINRIYNFTSNLGSIFSIQSLGRGLRRFPGKEDCIYYDWNDRVPCLDEHTDIRMQTFEREGHEIETFIYK